MNFIEIAKDKNVCKDNNLKIKILIFTEGTIIGPRNLFQILIMLLMFLLVLRVKRLVIGIDKVRI